MIKNYKPLEINWSMVDRIKQDASGILSTFDEKTSSRHSLHRPRSNTPLALYRVIANTLFDLKLKTVTDYVYLEKDFYNNIEEIITIKAYAAAIMGYGENKLFGLNFPSSDKGYSDYSNLKEWDYDNYCTHRESINCYPREALLDDEYEFYLLGSPVQYIIGNNLYDASLTSLHSHISLEVTKSCESLFRKHFPSENLPELSHDNIDLVEYIQAKNKNQAYSLFTKESRNYEISLMWKLKISAIAEAPKVYFHVDQEIPSKFSPLQIIFNNSSALENVSLINFGESLARISNKYSEAQLIIDKERVLYEAHMDMAVPRIKAAIK